MIADPIATKFRKASNFIRLDMNEQSVTPSNQRSVNSSSLDEIKDSDQSSNTHSPMILLKKKSPSQRSPKPPKMIIIDKDTSQSRIIDDGESAS